MPISGKPKMSKAEVVASIPTAISKISEDIYCLIKTISPATKDNRLAIAGIIAKHFHLLKNTKTKVHSKIQNNSLVVDFEPTLINILKDLDALISTLKDDKEKHDIEELKLRLIQEVSIKFVDYDKECLSYLHSKNLYV